MTAPTAAERHAALIAGLRDAADFFEAHPDLPMPQGVRMYAGAAFGRREPERFAAVHDAAEAMGVLVTVSSNRGREAKCTFGPVELTVFAPADEVRPGGAPVSRLADTAAVAP